MKILYLILPPVLTFLSGTALAQFMPRNDLHLQDSIFSINNVSQSQFNKVLDQIEAHFKPLMKQNFNANFVITRKWNDSTVNAYALQVGNRWQIEMYGGMARRPEVTADGFMAVACHEVGHHLGGYPFKQWASNEGQSDYFATLSCLRTLWQDELEENAKYAAVIPAYPKAQCDKVWEGPDDRNLCYRAMMAGKSLGNLLSKAAKFETPDRRVVTRTSDTHPGGQCRLDTYVAGALCTAKFDDGVIPGKQSVDGRNSAQSERESAESTCHAVNGDTAGLRPRCWFKPLLSNP